MDNSLKKSSSSILEHTHSFTGYQGSIPYLKAVRGAIDGINRHHVRLYGRCDICNEDILVAYVHANAETDELFFTNTKKKNNERRM